MTRSRSIDLALGILDHQLVDSEDRLCGKVDDLELAGLADGDPVVVALLSGPPVWRGRGPLGRLAARLARGSTVRVPWEHVAEVGADVCLRRTAAELRLGRGDARFRPWIERLPRSR